MSLEAGRKSKKEFLKGAALGASMLAGGLGGAYSETERMMKDVNSHVLTPAALEMLQKETGASDEEVAKVEQTLRHLLSEEVKRLRRG